MSGNNMLEMKGHTNQIVSHVTVLCYSYVIQLKIVLFGKVWMECKDEVIVSSSLDRTIRIWNYKGITNKHNVLKAYMYMQ